MTMRAYTLSNKSGSGKIVLGERDTPAVQGDQVLVAVRATSLNYRDVLIARGTYAHDGSSAGSIPLSDGAGEVVAVGPTVSRFKAGDRVAAAFMPGFLDGDLTAEKQEGALGGASVDGMLAERVVVAESGLVRIPDHLSFEEAATLPCAGVTAWYALFEGGHVLPGRTVLLLGTGGVSIFALQFAKAAGARLIITSSSDEKLKRARALGADETINYRTYTQWQDEVLRLTGGRGVDLAVETGGAGTFNSTVSAVRYSGSISLMGVLTGSTSEINLSAFAGKNIRVQGTYVGSVAMFERMNAALSTSRIVPVVDRVFAFEEAAEAYALMESGEHFGKIVIRVDDGKGRSLVEPPMDRP